MVNYGGHPGDSPRDLRARGFQVQWATKDFNPPSDEYLREPRPVYRASYGCSGKCTWDKGEGSGDGSDSDGSASNEGVEREVHCKQRSKRCPHGVKLVVSSSSRSSSEVILIHARLRLRSCLTTSITPTSGSRMPTTTRIHAPSSSTTPASFARELWSSRVSG